MRARIFQTTAFKLTALYFVVFSVFSVGFVLYVTYNTSQVLSRQLTETIDTEIRSIAEQGRSGGLRAIVLGVETRSRRPGASLYLLADENGRFLAGNVAEVPAGLLDRTDPAPLTIPYVRDSEAGAEQRVAIVRVVEMQGGLHLLVGRDVVERERFREIIVQALGWALGLMVVLGLISWVFVSRRVLKRIDQAAATSRRIMQGDLTGRLDVNGTGDEFDRLAESLNAMLGRIEQLLYSLKDVSDNIAHDLKTPLTRLRNRVETALAGTPDADRYRSALEATIEESDQLIRTFNALLMIARVEAGSPDGAMAQLDLAAIARDVAELYEPLAEEAGVELTIEAGQPVPLFGNRELLSQAVANLLDNAVKYGRPAEPGAAVRVSLTVTGEGSERMLRVDDNGPGIPAEDRERVLQRFVRLEKSRSAPGSGLGLSLVAAVARLHGGTIELGDNRPGLSVTIRFPAASPVGGRAAA